jgi:hypothetical protein
MSTATHCRRISYQLAWRSGPSSIATGTADAAITISSGGPRFPASTEEVWEWLVKNGKTQVAA